MQRNLPDPGPAIATPMAGPWSDGAVPAARQELARYLDDVADGSLDGLVTGCVPWTGRDVTVHLAETFRRFSRMLDQGRRGDFTPPFTPDELDAENLRAVEDFTGEPVEALRSAAGRFLDEVDDLDEPVPHQLGTIPTGLLVLFGVLDLALHHDDVLVPAGRRHRPEPSTLEAVRPVIVRLFGVDPGQDDPWAVIVVGSGRPETVNL
jgi:uncharacterized protein (TIGR03083 family)